MAGPPVLAIAGLPDLRRRVSGTWLLMLAARAGGLAVDSAALALLLGASVVGAAHWIEARLPQQRSALLWKALALPIGFIAAYAVVAAQWIPAAGAAARYSC